jgi:signal transduction histidine kinase
MRLNFRDNGRGIPEQVLQNGSSDGHFGLPGMAERAEKIGARFSIFSRVGGGTEIEIKISSRLAYRSSSTRKHRNLLK